VIVINYEPTTHQAKRVMTNSLSLSANTIHQPEFPQNRHRRRLFSGREATIAVSDMSRRETKLERVLPNGRQSPAALATSVAICRMYAGRGSTNSKAVGHE
jgi:hypothetical protein